MKFKKILISASAIAAGSGLLATVLTSCAKASVDEKLKATLDDNGLLYNTGNMGDAYKLDYKSAVEAALSRSSTWVQFKNALADEIVFKWFENRMSSKKDAADKNANFRTSYDEWVYQIDKDYKDTIQNCKNKYGANWEFYLQNEYLAPLGGTEESYKHAKLVEKVKADFISKVFAKNYFGYKTETTTTDDILPHIYVKATKNINKNTLRNPENWGNIGFFAKTELSFAPTGKPTKYDEVDADWLAKNPDGDYAAIQDYVFNRWFKTEKPFFASAALFKYSNPKNVAHGKLDEIYDGTRTQVKIPTDKPSEAFPFFGAGTGSGTDKANLFIKNLKAGAFATKFDSGDGQGEQPNGTITIPTENSDDGQTCLLVSGNQMFTALYTPYAMACGNLYAKIFENLFTTKESLNKLDAATVIANITEGYTGVTDDFNILKNFFYKNGDTIPSGITKKLDLNEIYGGLDEATNVYHCPLFQDCSTYKYFYGDETKGGIRYVANTIQVDDFQSDNEWKTGQGKWTPAQPWVMELNEAGMHILTIDGFNYVKSGTATQTGTEEADRLARLKKVVMFRLLQKQSNDEGAAGVSTDLLGESGKLKTYFNDNFTNIILELATFDSQLTDPKAKKQENDKYNVFRTIESYKLDESTKEDNLFLHTIWKDQKLGNEYSKLTSFLQALDEYEQIKKTVSTLETANSKIYSYRSKQVTNSKVKEKFGVKTVYENGLLAPFAYEPIYYDAKGSSKDDVINNCMYDYSACNRVVVQDWHTVIVAKADDNVKGWTELNKKIKAITEHEYIKEVTSGLAINGDNGFSPQISTAKSKTSNRFWYKSTIVDKFMYSYMGNKSNTANAIKKNAYNYYVSQHHADWFDEEKGAIWTNSASSNAFLTTVAKNKVLSGDKNLASYIPNVEQLIDSGKYSANKFYTLMGDNYESALTKTFNESGINADDFTNFALFQATVAYLISSDKTTGASDFDNFYTILNSKIGEDDTAIVGYLANAKMGDEAESLNPNAIEGKINDFDESTKGAIDYRFNPNVDNMFDYYGYEGRTITPTTDNSRTSLASHWTVVQRKYEGQSYDFGGFTGLQTKSSNQLDSASKLQDSVFNKFAKATFNSYDVLTGTKHEQNDGCWFQFAGAKDAKGEYLNMHTLTVGTETFDADVWFPKTPVGDKDYSVVRKIAKKIREYGSMDDLRALAKTLSDAYDGRSDFTDIAEGIRTFEDVDQMRMEMLKLLPSTKYKSDTLNCFQRVANVEAHTIANNPSVVFEDNSSKNSYKLLMTQINKADAIEKTLSPTWDDDNKTWKMPENSPITAEEFWIILFNIASESTVQQRAITEVVKCAFGDKKLIVYDAQLYNQFDSVWIKDWSKKTMGA